MAVEGSVPAEGAIVPHLVVADAATAVEFYRRAFSAEILYRSPSPSGNGEHIHLRLWSSLVQISTEEPDQRRTRMEGSLLGSPETLGGSTCVFQVGVPDVDAAYRRAVDNGAMPALPPVDMFWGDRYGWVRDPFGHMWAFCTVKEILSPQQVQERLQDLVRSGGGKEKVRWFAVLLLVAQALCAQSSAPKPGHAWEALRFLEGDWKAKTSGDSSGPAVSGTYAFRRELDGHILARHSNSGACKGPAGFDCDHRDLLYIYEDSPGQPLKAIYFDSEGHVIHYEVTTPATTTAVLLSDASVPGPQFRLTYELKNGIMSGKFQVHMPGQQEWKSYLEWSGAKK